MTLTEAAFWTKRVGVIVLVLGGLFAIIALIITAHSQEVLPPEYLTPNYACTQRREEFLEHKLDIPSLEVNTDSQNVFDIQTDTGKVSNFANLDIINVHKYRQKSQQVDSQVQAKKIASMLGFDPDGIHRRGTTEYIWSNTENSRSLSVDARFLNFVMTTNSGYIRDVSKEVSIPTENEAISIAKNALRRLNILGADYNYNDPGNINTYLINITPDGAYSQAPALIDAELIRVDFLKTKPMISIRENIVNSQSMISYLNQTIGTSTQDETIINNERIKIHNYSTIVTYQNPSLSNISIYVGPEDPNSEKLSNVYRIEFTYWPLDVESCGTYELVSTTYAVDQVQAGNGSLVYLNEKNGDEVREYQPRTVLKYAIDNIAIAYYESINQQMFLQPVYVISGQATFKDDVRGEFHFFYPAINYDIVQDRVELPEADTVDGGGSMFGL